MSEILLHADPASGFIPAYGITVITDAGHVLHLADVEVPDIMLPALGLAPGSKAHERYQSALRLIERANWGGISEHELFHSGFRRFLFLAPIAVGFTPADLVLMSN